MSKRIFKSPDKKYSKFDTTTRPNPVSQDDENYEKKALRKSDNTTLCTYISPLSGNRCGNKLGLYPEFCRIHTMKINNVYIHKSEIPKTGNGLFAGEYGFKKGNIIGKYNYPWNETNLGKLYNRCKNDNCWSYIFCKDGERKNTKCWDGLDIRSTLMRNINDAHGSDKKNNAYFDIVNKNVYVIASKNIKPYSEIYVSYGNLYWKKNK